MSTAHAGGRVFASTLRASRCTSMTRRRWYPRAINSASSGLELERDEASLHVDDPSNAGHGVTDRGGRKVVDVDVRTDGALPLIQERDDRVAGGVLEEPDQPRRTEDRRHAPFGEIDRVGRLDHEPPDAVAPTFSPLRMVF